MTDPTGASNGALWRGRPSRSSIRTWITRLARSAKRTSTTAAAHLLVPRMLEAAR
jgi:hypothetical protein